MVQATETSSLKVGELADRTGKTVRALRLYEERGLLAPSMRSPGGFRLYNQGLVDRVVLIDSLQSVGMSLAEIAELLALYDGATTPKDGMKSLRAEYQHRLEEVRRRIETLRTVERLLDRGVEFMDDCDPCAQASLGCACHDCDRLETAGPELLMVTGLTGG